MTLYLVRRNVEAIIGPMTLEEFKKRFERMEFGMQDEIAGHCGRWVVLEDILVLRRNYPPIYEYIKSTVGTWVSGIHKQDRLDQSGKLKRRRNRLAVVCAVVSILGGIVGYTFRQTLSDVYYRFDEKPLVAQLTKLAALAPNTEFVAYIKDHRGLLTSMVRQDPESQVLPFLRAYAFLQDGKMEGLPNDILMGQAVLSRPENCSVDMWLRVYVQLLQRRTLDGTYQALSANEWLRLIYSDFHWIRLRQEERWISPPNGWIACLMSAQRAFYQKLAQNLYYEAFLETFGDLAKDVLDSIDLRFRWLNLLVPLTTIAQATQPLPKPEELFNTDHFVKQLTCYEMVQDLGSLRKCYRKLELGQEMQTYLYRRYLVNYLRILSHEDTVPPVLLNYLKTNISSLALEDPVHGFDYTPEFEYARLLQKSAGNVTESLNKVAKEYPQIDFASYRNP